MLKATTYVYIIALLVFLVGCNVIHNNKEGASSPNILLIVADDLGYTDLGCFGSEISTPNIDKLAEVGVINTSFYTSPTCAPTRAMLLTGVDNHRNGLGTMGRAANNQKGAPGYEGYLNFDVATLPEILLENGYHTSMAGKWHLSRPSLDTTKWPGNRGFQRYFSLIQAGASHFSDKQPLFSSRQTTYVEDGQIVDRLPENFYSSNYYADKIIEYIDESSKQNKPFFSYVAFTAPHWPLHVPDQHINTYRGFYDDGYEVLAKKRIQSAKDLKIIDDNVVLNPLTPNVIPWEDLNTSEKQLSARTMEVYAAMVNLMNYNIGRIINHLKVTGQYDNTLIIFMSDNGAEGNSILGIGDTREWIAVNNDNTLENIGRKNSYVSTGPSWAQVSSLPFSWYKSFSTEGGVRSPSVISYPKWKHNFKTINNNVLTVMDITPTILDFVNIKNPGGSFKNRKIHPIDGKSLLPWLQGIENITHSDEKAHCWELYGRRGVRKGKWKAEKYDKPYGTGNWELYNLEDDPGEFTNLSSDYPNKLKELVNDWDIYAKDYSVILPEEKVTYGTDEIWRVN